MTITPMLWFDEQALDAAEFYVSIFSKREGSGPTEIGEVMRYGEAGPRPAGMVMTVAFTIDGRPFTALNGGPQFQFNEAVSFVVNCASQDEVDYFWDALGDGGEHGPCGWLKDKFGLSWQVVPDELDRLIADPVHGQAVMQSMLGMSKLDLTELRAAAAR